MRKIIALDAVRGLAAFIVLTGHFFDGLDPAISRRAAGTALAGLFNGTAAVVLFFVLSGFVLTIRPIRRGRISLLLPLIMKRWPRLAGTVAVAGVCYSAVAWAGGFPPLMLLPHPVIQSQPYLFWGQTLHDERFGQVLAEASVRTFVEGSAHYNPVLWTMHWELLGSFLAAGLAFTVLLPVSRIPRAALFLGLGIMGAAYSPWLLPFPLGVAGAVLHLRLGHRIRLGGLLASAMVAGSVLIWSWDVRFNTGLWSWTSTISYQPRLQLWMILQSIAASFCMAAALYCPALQKALGGRAGAFAGRLSFPLYLMHLLVMLTFSSWAAILLAPSLTDSQFGIGALFVATCGMTVAAALPIAMFDAWWVRALDNLSKRAVAMIRPASWVDGHS